MVVLQITLPNGQVVEREVPRAMVDLMVSTLSIPVSGSVVGVSLTVLRESVPSGPPGWPY